jgi:outer membrane receptor protein involved in Fe transport
LKTQTIKQRLLHSTMIGGAALMALVAAPAVMLATPTVAVAQDYTNGTLTGVVRGTDGQPVAGANITVRSAAQGITRTATTGADGSFRVALIPTGRYDVTVDASGYDSISDQVAVSLGGSSGYDFTIARTGAAADATDVGEIVVTGVRQQLDFSRTATGVTVDVDELVDQVPVARNITAVTLLAPGAVQGDSAFAVGSAQFEAPPALGGSSPAENAFFVNGLNITNFVNGLGGATVPFEFYKTVEIKTGGYAAEFGRSTGGVINAVTKSGTNEFTLELHGTWAPDSLREDAPNTPANSASLGTLNDLGEFEEKTFTVELGGPIIRDRLFAYGIAAWQDTEAQSGTFSGPTNGTLNRDTFSDDPFVGVKLDGYITSDHRLEFTYFDTSRERSRAAFDYNPTTGVAGASPLTTTTTRQGGENWVARYTGSFTDWLTLSAAYGETTVDQASIGNLVGQSLVQDNRLDPSNNSYGNARRSTQTASATTDPFLAERKFYRADADVYLELMGQHHIRFGYDHEDTTLNIISSRNGGGNFVYLTASASTAASLGIAQGQEYATRRIFTSGGGFEGANEAYYIQDSWDVTDRLNLQLGIRNDAFMIQNPVGDTFIDFKDNWGPRLGFAFDPVGDARSKFYGSFGRYFLPPASNTAFRMAAPAIDITEFFLPSGGGMYFGAGQGSLSGFDPATGLPTAGFGPQIINRPSFQPCPAGTGTNAPAGTVACSVRNNGSAPDPNTLSAKNLAATFEDEFIIGYQNRITDNWTVGVNAVYRNLGRAAEDALLDDGVLAYCARNNIAGCDANFPGQSFYLIINPGEDVVAQVTLPNSPDPQIITINAADLGIPKVRREYAALEFTFERAFDGIWGLQGSYTLSRSEGNYEGGVKSDIGQTDSGITQDFDFLAFLPGSYGLLPNHRAHQFKVFGSWQATENLLIGANVSVISPRHYGCVGLAPTGYSDGDVANNSYGAAARFCNGLVVDRGSVFESDWRKQIDLSFRYSLDDMVPGNLVLRADIFNVFNFDAAVEMNEFGEDDGGNPDPNYMAPNTYQPGRSVRLGFDWAF